MLTSPRVSRALVLGLLLLGSTPRLAHAAAATFESHLSAAVGLYEELEYERALKRLELARRRARGPAQRGLVSLHRGILLAELGRWPAARQAFRLALKREPHALLPLTEPRIYRYNPSLREWRRDTTLFSTTGLDQLRDIHVVHSKLAYAVGYNGSVVRWNGASWQRMPGPSSTTDLEAVWAFGTSAVYVASAGGSIYRFNGATWQHLEDFDFPLWDIVGTSPENMWVVGEKGTIIHWPR